jgi:hypothetical protein
MANDEAALTADIIATLIDEARLVPEDGELRVESVARWRGFWLYRRRTTKPPRLVRTVRCLF